MAKLYILSDEQIKSGARPKTPKQKLRYYKIACGILTILLLIEPFIIHWLK